MYHTFGIKVDEWSKMTALEPKIITQNTTVCIKLLQIGQNKRQTSFLWYIIKLYQYLESYFMFYEFSYFTRFEPRKVGDYSCVP